MRPTVISLSDQSHEEAKKIAMKLDLPFESQEPSIIPADKNLYYFVVEKENKYLKVGKNNKSKPIFCNFTEWASNKKKSNLVRCMKGLPLDCSVVDATAGFGRDSLELATVSASVLMIERLPWMHYLLQQGIRETKKEPGLSLTKKLSLQLADSHNYLSSAEQFTDVVYLDPMFPNAGSARAKKNIQALRDLTEEDQSDDLLPLAISFAKKRVIVKRHKNSEYLNQHKPTFSISGRVIRFDVYEI